MIIRNIFYTSVLFIYASLSYGQECKIHHYNQISEVSMLNLKGKGYEFIRMDFPNSPDLNTYTRHIPPGEFGFNIITHSVNVNQIGLLMRDHQDERGVMQIDPQSIFNLPNRGNLESIHSSFPSCSDLMRKQDEIERKGILGESINVVAELMRMSKDKDLNLEEISEYWENTKHKNVGELIIETEFLLHPRVELMKWRDELKLRKRRYNQILDEIKSLDFENIGTTEDFEKLRKFLIQGALNKYCKNQGVMNNFFNILNPCGSCTAQTAFYTALSYDLGLKSVDGSLWAIQDFSDHRRIVFYNEDSDQSYDLTYGPTFDQTNTGPLFRRPHLFWLLLKEANRKEPGLMNVINQWFYNEIPEDYFLIRKEQHGFGVLSRVRSVIGPEVSSDNVFTIYQDSKGFTRFSDEEPPEAANLNYLSPEQIEQIEEEEFSKEERIEEPDTVTDVESYLDELDEEMVGKESLENSISTFSEEVMSLSKEELGDIVENINTNASQNSSSPYFNELTSEDLAFEVLEGLKSRGQDHFDQSSLEDLQEELISNFESISIKDSNLIDRNFSEEDIINRRIESLLNGMNDQAFERLQSKDYSVLDNFDINDTLRNLIENALDEIDNKELQSFSRLELQNKLMTEVYDLYQDQVSNEWRNMDRQESDERREAFFVQDTGIVFPVWLPGGSCSGCQSQYAEKTQRAIYENAEFLNPAEKQLVLNAIDDPNEIIEVLHSILEDSDYLRKFYSEVIGEILLFAPFPVGVSEEIVINPNPRVRNFHINQTTMVSMLSQITMPEDKLAVYSSLSNKERFAYLQRDIENRIDEIFENPRFEVLENILLKKNSIIEMSLEDRQELLVYMESLEGIGRWNEGDYSFLPGSYISDDIKFGHSDSVWPNEKYSYIHLGMHESSVLTNVRKLNRIRFAALQYGKYYTEVDPVAELRKIETYSEEDLFDFIVFNAKVKGVNQAFFMNVPEFQEGYFDEVDILGVSFSIYDVNNYAMPMKSFMANIFYNENKLITVQSDELERKLIDEHAKDNEDDEQNELDLRAQEEESLESESLLDLKFELVEESEFRQHFERIDRLTNLNKREEVYIKPEVLVYLFLLQEDSTLKNPVFQLLSYRMWRKSLSLSIKSLFESREEFREDLRDMTYNFRGLWRTSPLITHQGELFDLSRESLDSATDCLDREVINWTCFLLKNDEQAVKKPVSSWINNNPFVQDAYNWYLRVEPTYRSYYSQSIIENLDGADQEITVVTPRAPVELLEIFNLGQPATDNLPVEDITYKSVNDFFCKSSYHIADLFPENGSFKTSFVFNQQKICQEDPLLDASSQPSASIDAIMNSAGIFSSTGGVEHSYEFAAQGMALQRYPVKYNAPLSAMYYYPRELLISPYFNHTDNTVDQY